MRTSDLATLAAAVAAMQLKPPQVQMLGIRGCMGSRRKCRRGGSGNAYVICHVASLVVDTEAYHPVTPKVQVQIRGGGGAHPVIPRLSPALQAWLAGLMQYLVLSPQE